MCEARWPFSDVHDPYPVEGWRSITGTLPSRTELLQRGQAASFRALRALRARARRAVRTLRTVRIAIAAVLAGLLLARGAASSEPALPLRVAYSAPAGCPGRDALLTHVSTRTTRTRTAAPNEPARELVVRIDAQKGGFRGRLVVPASADGPHQEREVASKSCDELVEALGFFIALTLDPNASATPPQAPAPIPTPPLVPPPSALPPAAVLAPAAPPSAAPPRVPPPVRAPARSTWHLGFGTGIAAVGGVAPTVRLGNRFFVELAAFPAHARASDGSHAPTDPTLFAPSLSLSGVSTATATSVTSHGTVALRWQALTAEACPVRVLLSRSIWLRPCAGFELGRLRGDGVGIARAQRNDALWIAVELAGRLTLDITSRIFGAIELGAAAPLDRPRFRYASGAVAFDTSAVGGRGALTVGLVF